MSATKSRLVVVGNWCRIAPNINPYNAALNYGDGRGGGYEEVARPRQVPGAELAGLAMLAPGAHAALVSELATLDAADSTIIAGTDQTGLLRYNGRKELAAIGALEVDTIDPSPNQSATAVLDKISGAGLIRARQQQARIQFLGAIVEQLLVDDKRSRDTESSGHTATLTHWSFGQLATIAGAPPNYLRSLPASIASSAINYGLSRIERAQHQLFVADTAPWTVHAITSPRYARVHHDELASRVA